MIKPLIRTIVILCLFLSVGSLAYAENASYKRIISLSPTLTEELYLLEADDLIVGVTSFCQKPEASMEKEKIGEVINVNFEKIVALEPDAILATSLTNKRSVDRMKQLGLNVLYFDYAKDFTDICDHFLRLARPVGKETRAREILAGIENRVETIRKRNEKATRKRVFLQIGANPLFEAKKDSN